MSMSLLYMGPSSGHRTPDISHQCWIKEKNHLPWHVGKALPNRAQEAGGHLLLFSLNCLIPFSKLSSVFCPDTLSFCCVTSLYPPFFSIVFLLHHSYCFSISMKCNMEHPVQGVMGKVYFSIDSGSGIVFKNLTLSLHQPSLPLLCLG